MTKLEKLPKFEDFGKILAANNLRSSRKKSKMPSRNSRQEANRKILGLLAQAVERNPDFRFHQLLQNFGIEIPHIDQFYEESTKTLEILSAMASECYGITHDGFATTGELRRRRTRQ